MACSDWLRRDVLEIERDPWVCSIFFFSDMHTLLYLFIWSHWVFVTARELSLVAESGSYSLFAGQGLLILVAAFFFFFCRAQTLSMQASDSWRTGDHHSGDKKEINK